MSGRSSRSRSSESYSKDENYDPNAEVSLDLNGASIILHRYLSLSCLSLEVLKRGFNNRTYIVIASENNSKYIIRLQGRHWTKAKTEGEVAAIIFLNKKFTHIPLPKIFGYCSSKELSGIGNEYILMEYLDGVTLEDVFLNMNIEDQKEIISQFVIILSNMKSIKFSQIGSFVFLPRISETNGIGLNIDDIGLDDIAIGPVLDQQVGPFRNYLDYYKELCGKEIEALRKCKFMGSQLKNLSRIENFVRSVTDPETTFLSKEVQNNVEIVFIHGDLESRNMLVKDGEIVGIIDFEFSGAFPTDNEWIDGFLWCGRNTSEAFVFNEVDVDSGKTILPEELKSFFISECQRLNIPPPNEIPEHFQRAELWHFMSNICPWYLRTEREDIPKHWFKERDDALRRVDAVLAKYGF